MMIILPADDEIMMTIDHMRIVTHRIDDRHLEAVSSTATETGKDIDPLGAVVLEVSLEALRDETDHQAQD
jgi:hypothetical protein